MMPSDITIAKLAHALVRLLWNSVSDGASCTCSAGDRCPQCEAMQALGYARWISADDAARCLAPYGRRRP